MKEFLNCVWNLIKEPYIFLSLINVLIIFSLDGFKIVFSNEKEK